MSSVTNEEREAAQRILDTPDISFDGAAVQSVESSDAKLVAAAYLREHPADDEELIDSTWVESIELQSDMIENSQYLYCNQGQWQFWLGPWIHLRDVNARGDVRRLREALMGD